MTLNLGQHQPRRKAPRELSPKNSAVILTVRATVVAAFHILQRAEHILRDTEDSAPLRKRVQEAMQAIGKASSRLQTEYKFLRWKEDRIAAGEWLGGQPAHMDGHDLEDVR